MTRIIDTIESISERLARRNKNQSKKWSYKVWNWGGDKKLEEGSDINTRSFHKCTFSLFKRYFSHSTKMK